MGKHSRDRSPKRRDNDRRDRDKDRRDHDRDRRHDRDRGRDRDRGHSRPVHKDIDAVKKNLKSKMNSAIDDIRRLDQPEQSSTSVDRSDKDHTLTASETMRRTTRIDKIEQSGFTPAAFVSTRGAKREVEKKTDKDHESAVFGAAWKSKELTKKLAEQQKSTVQPNLNSIPMPQGLHFDNDFNDFPLAMQWLNTNPEQRQKRWMEIWHEQRRKLFDGAL